uniref:Pyrin domain-containing protein n=1 Tax=Seriola lalandi dorsalis TaxID=1841481 RepID=A0A3B4YME4_SERLL
MGTDLLLEPDSSGHEFQKFKWHLQQGDGSKGYPSIPEGRLEEAEMWRTVDLMEQTYTAPKAVEVTRKILKKINRNDLVLSLSDAKSATEGQFIQ